MSADGRTPAQGEETTTTPSRRIARRPGLPSGRAVVGALLVTLAVVGLFLAYQSATAGPDTTFVVVTGSVDAGDRLAESHLAVRKMELSDDVAAFTLTELEQAVGAVALHSLQPGRLLQGDDVLLPGVGEDPTTPPTFELSLAVDRERSLAGTLQTGEAVDLVATFGDSVDCALVVAEDARVIRIDRTDDDLLSSTGRHTLTLAITEPDRLLQTIYASDEAQLTVVRSSKATGLDLTGRFCVSDLAVPGETPPDQTSGGTGADGTTEGG